jgi:hypothetical protein
MRFSKSLPSDSDSAKTTTKVRISLGDFEHRAKQINVYDCQPFFSSRYFISNGFRLSDKFIEKDI